MNDKAVQVQRLMQRIRAERAREEARLRAEAGDPGWKLFAEGLVQRLPDPIPAGEPFDRAMSRVPASRPTWVSIPAGTTADEALARWRAEGDPRADAWSPDVGADRWRSALALVLVRMFQLDLQPRTCLEVLARIGDDLIPELRTGLLKIFERDQTLPAELMFFLLASTPTRDRDPVDINGTFCFELTRAVYDCVAERTRETPPELVERMPWLADEESVAVADGWVVSSHSAGFEDIDAVTIGHLGTGRAIRYRYVANGMAGCDPGSWYEDGFEWKIELLRLRRLEETEGGEDDGDKPPDWLAREIDEGLDDDL